MKKLIIGTLVALSATSVLAQEKTNLYLKAGVDISSKYSSTELQGGKVNGGKTKNSGTEFVIEATRFVTPSFELGAGVGYQIHGKPDKASSLIEKNSFNKGDKLTVENTSYRSIPLYVTGKYNFSYGNIKPYIKSDLGYSFNFNNKDLKYKLKSHDEKANPSNDNGKVHTNVENGLYFGIGTGIEYNNFVVELSYKINKAKMTYNEKYLGKHKKKYDYSRTTLSVGYKFDI